MKKELENLKKSLNTLGLSSYGSKIKDVIKIAQEFDFDFENFDASNAGTSPSAFAKKIKNLSAKFYSKNYTNTDSTVFESMSIDMAEVRKAYESLSEDLKRRVRSSLSDEEAKFLDMCISSKEYESNVSQESIQRVRQFAMETRRSHYAAERIIKQRMQQNNSNNMNSEQAQNEAIDAAGEYYDKIYDSFYRLSKEDQQLVRSIAKGHINAGSEYKVLKEYFGKE
jgi:hypothetical protein